MPGITSALDPLHIALIAVSALLLLVSLWLARTLGKAGRRLAALEGNAAAGQSQEYRVEQFGVLWFPTVSFSPSAKAVTRLAPGLPHCPACVRALASKDGEGWGCPKCGNKYPESLVDVHVTDQVSKLALRYFQERHPDFVLQS